MRAQNTIVINGKVYDAISGLPAGAPDVITPAAAESKTAVHSATKAVTSEVVHSRIHKAKVAHRPVQRSQTLRRDIVKQPAQHKPARHKPTPGLVAKSPMISRFAAHPQALPKAPTPHTKSSPVIHRATHPSAITHTSKSALSSRELKEKLIAERLANAQSTQPTRDHKAPRKSFFARAPRVSSVVAACFAIVFLGGYLTYINMPNLSMRVAAANAGVDATFPDYRPDGYRFDGPIAYNSGEVNVKFASNTNHSGYTIGQKSSSWDSQAVLDNYVSKKSKDYLTYSEQGLTIYTYEGKAAWVNGGVFYTIEGDAPLSSDQILRIASSM
mgnify:CR=1 FL=1